MYTLDKNNTSPLGILCTLMPQIIPLLTLMLDHTWYEKSIPQKHCAHLTKKNIFTLTSYNICISTLILKGNDNLRHLYFFIKWSNSHSDPMIKIVCGVGSAHNRATYLLFEQTHDFGFQVSSLSYRPLLWVHNSLEVICTLHCIVKLVELKILVVKYTTSFWNHHLPVPHNLSRTNFTHSRELPKAFSAFDVMWIARRRNIDHIIGPGDFGQIPIEIQEKQAFLSPTSSMLIIFRF